jgi:hypothetical protein
MFVCNCRQTRAKTVDSFTSIRLKILQESTDFIKCYQDPEKSICSYMALEDNCKGNSSSLTINYTSTVTQPYGSED